MSKVIDYDAIANQVRSGTTDYDALAQKARGDIAPPASALPPGESLTSGIDRDFGTHIGMPDLGQMALGAGQYFTNQLHNAGQVVRHLPIIGKALDSLPNLVNVDPALMATKTPSTNIGQGLAKAAEFAAPSGDAALAMKAAGILPKMLAQSGIGAGVGLMQGQSPKDAAMSGATAGAATGALEGAWPAMKDFVANKITPRSLNSLMGVAPKMLESGAQPGEQIAKDGLIAGSKESLKQQVDQQTKDTGLALNAVLTKSSAGARIDPNPIMNGAMSNAKNRISGPADPAFEANLQKIFQRVKEEMPGTFPTVEKFLSGDNNSLPMLTPLQAQNLKKTIGDSIRWTGAAYEGDLNEVLLDMYRGLNSATKEAVPEAAPLLSKYQNYQVAKNALEDSILKDRVSDPFKALSVTGILKAPIPTGTGFRTGLGALSTGNLAPMLQGPNFATPSTILGPALMNAGRSPQR